VLRLHTLGTTYVAGPDGAPLTGAATHRRTLALLGLLATAGSAGLDRDKIIGVLWPDTDEARARHSLTQGLYAARRALECDDLFTINGPNIRLNPERISSDLQEFDALIARGALAEAVELHRGPFLDAVFLADAGEFERWSSTERDRLTHRLVDALESLAAQAESDGEAKQAVRWRRQQASLLPLDGRVASKLMLALANAGDRAGALRHAQVHASLLREELDLSPDADVVALVERLRAAPVSVERPAEVRVEEPPAVIASVPTEMPRVMPTRRRRPSVAWAAAIILVALVGLGALVARKRSAPALVATVAAAPHVVVAPFRVTGADPSLAFLHDGMVELLSARIADDSTSRSVDAGAVLRAWRARGVGAADDVGRDTALALAASLGARRVVMGSVVGTSSRMVLSATMLDVGTRRVAAQVTAAGTADSLVALVDRLAAKLLVSDAGQESVLAHYTSRSLPALKAFLAAQAAYHRGDDVAALRFYERAIQRDSSFALAALNAAATADALHLAVTKQEAIAVAWRSRDDLNQRDLAALRAMAGPQYPLLATASEYTSAWQHVVDAAPRSSDAWHTLAVRLLEDGRQAGLRDARDRAIAALQRALALSAQNTRARSLIASLTGQLSASDTLDDASAWRRALAAGDSTARGQVRTRFRVMDTPSLRTIALAGQYDARGMADARAALDRLRTRSMTQAERVTTVLLEHSLAMNEGRAADALAATDRLHRVLPGSDAWLRFRILDALYAGGDSAAAARALATLSAPDPSSPLARPVTSAGQLANACVVAQWRLSRDDTTHVRRTIDALRGASLTAAPSMVTATPAACAELLDAGLSVALRGPDARARLLRTDSLVFTAQTAGGAAQYAHLAIARMFARLGDTASALAAVQKRPYMAGAPRYLASALQLEAALSSSGER
jgi:DNA-binding SARP family transcriptional activator